VAEINWQSVSAEDPAPRRELAGLSLMAFPNPVQTSATVALNVQIAQYIRVAVYDLLGREVAALADEQVAAGIRHLQFNTSGLAAGLYVLRAETETGSLSERISVVK
jgi:hypothetical protein